MSRLILKNIGRENQIFSHRVIISMVIMAVLFGFLAYRIADLQVVQHDHFTTRSKDNRVKILPITPPRGLIFSRDGVLLAENIPTFSLEVIPEKAGDIDELIVNLNSTIGLSGDEIQRFKKEIKRKRQFENIPIKYKLSEEEIARFSVNQYRFPGVEVATRLVRHYPHGEDFVHMLGYVGRINEKEEKRLDKANYSATSHIGKTGIEKSYEPQLHGRVGYQQVEINAQGRVVQVLDRKSPLPGHDLYLTIDTRLQSIAAEALGKRRGAVVAIDPNTGAVLAMVSYPSYDPNWFVNGISTDRYQQLSQSQDRPLFNRALQGQYPPGSTIKPFLGIAARYYGVRDEHDQTHCPGWFSLPGGTHRYRCWNKAGHGGVDLPRSIIESCDVFYYELAQTLGIDKIHDYLQGFGFGKVSGVDLSSESQGLLPSSEWKLRTKNTAWYPGETLITGIGQGYMLTTPFQLASATATLSMNGHRVIPRLVGQTEDPATGKSGDLLSELPVKVVEAEEADWRLVIQAMREVVLGKRGTARKVGAGAFYEFAGKTGTSQVFGLKQIAEENADKADIPERLRDHALFIAFAPIKNPVIAVAVVVENGGSGGRTAGPVARKLLDHYMDSN
ncbi:MAG: penicillin-binding protein 2 [Gammaproteobacteria bacterium]